ncbi:MAG TPA: hypothetical protein VKA70_16060, partial [Blastocatellia bacterium]|nr:hypothetical protein [Blastocatellia bacterium]
MSLRIAYLSQGKLRLKTEGKEVRTIESRFGQQVRERAIQIQQRNAWKTQGAGAQFMSGGLLWGEREHDPAEMRIAITGLSWGCQEAELLYALETDEIAGVFLVKEGGGEEQRLYHSSDYRVRHLSAHSGDGLIACTLMHKYGTSNIAVMRADGSDFIEVTEGDSIDLSPKWIRGDSRELVFQSAGIARNQDGRFSGNGPFTIQMLNLDNGEMTCLAEDPKSDLLAPQIDGEGSLYYIRRPYRQPVERFSLWKFVLDILLFPPRLLYAIFQWLNFFTVRYTGKFLTTGGGARLKEINKKQMMLWRNLNDAQRGARQGEGEEAPALVPKSWELVRQDGRGASQSLVKGVLSFDLPSDGSIVYSNGSAIFRMDKGGATERLVVDGMIEQVV